MAAPELRFEVYGRRIAVGRCGDDWAAWDLGADGKRRPADFQIPRFVAEAELAQYLADLFHESATPAHGDVRRIDRRP